MVGFGVWEEGGKGKGFSESVAGREIGVRGLWPWEGQGAASVPRELVGEFLPRCRLSGG